MNKKPFCLSKISLVAIISLAYLLCGAGNIQLDKSYKCAGKNDNGMVVNREFPTLHFSAHRIKVSGSDIFSAYNYELCDNSGAHVSFATQPELCRNSQGEINSLKDSYGFYNVDSGLLSLHGAQGLTGEYQCKEVSKN